MRKMFKTYLASLFILVFSTLALRFIPLPSEPEVSLAPEGCFEALGELIKKHNLRYTTRPLQLLYLNM